MAHLRVVAVTAAGLGACAVLASARRSAGGEVEEDVEDAEQQQRHADALQQLSRLTRGQEAIDRTAADADYEVALPARRTLTDEERSTYERDGFVRCRGWFSPTEIDLLRGTIEQDRTATGSFISVADTEGRDTKLTEWHKFGDDTFSMFGRSASLVRAASELMGRSEPFLSHAKLLLKEPRSGGAWEWHQDFGYWYNQGLLQPDKIINAIVAVDSNTEENGCMRLLSRSHRLGRIEHGKFAGQMCANPSLVAEAMQLPGFELCSLTMEPGDVAFMHSNTLHASAPNHSDSWRRNMITAFNSRSNGPVKGAPPGAQPRYARIEVVPDDDILRSGMRRLDPAGNDVVTQGDVNF